MSKSGGDGAKPVRVIENYIFETPFVANITTFYTVFNESKERVDFLRFERPTERPKYFINLRFFDERNRMLSILPSSHMTEEAREKYILVMLDEPLGSYCYCSVRQEYIYEFKKEEEAKKEEEKSKGDMIMCFFKRIYNIFKRFYERLYNIFKLLRKLFNEPEHKITAKTGPNHTHYINIRPPERLCIELLDKEKIEREGGKVLMSTPHGIAIRFDKTKKKEVEIKVKIAVPRLLKWWFTMVILLSFAIFTYRFMVVLLNFMAVPLNLPPLDQRLMISLLGVLIATRAWMIYEERMLRGVSTWCMTLILYGVLSYVFPELLSLLKTLLQILSALLASSVAPSDARISLLIEEL